jgi:hypothetical protein
VETLVRIQGADLDTDYIRNWLLEMVGQDDERMRWFESVIEARVVSTRESALCLPFLLPSPGTGAGMRIANSTASGGSTMRVKIPVARRSASWRTARRAERGPRRSPTSTSARMPQ